MRCFYLAGFLRWLIIGALSGIGAAGAAPFAYISNFGGSTVSVIDIATNTVVATVPVGAGPAGVAVNPAGAFVYVANQTSNNVSVIDAGTNTVVATVPVGVAPSGVAVNKAGTFAYVANTLSNNVSVIDTTSDTVVATVPVGTSPVGVAVNRAGTFAYVTSSLGDAVSVINTNTNTVVATVQVGRTPRGIALNPAGTFAYVASGIGQSVSVIDTATNAVVATVPMVASPGHIPNPVSVAVNPAGTLAYVAVAGTDTISAIDTTTNTVVMTMPVGSNVFGIALNIAGTFAYVASRASNSVSVFNTATNAVVATVPVGIDPVAFGEFIAPPPATGPGVPTSVTISSGSPQSTRVGTAFAQTLVALVKDSLGNPVPNVTVTWTPPAAGASATFNGPPSTVTDSSGHATIGATANAIFGAYTVAAQVSVLSASFNLTNAITISIGNTCSGNAATNADLVEHYYASILRRPSDAGGKAFWLGEADRLCGLGVDPKQTFFLLANYFYNSPEYLAFNRDNNGFVTDLYITFFGRLPDAAGLSFWLGQLAAGMTRNNLMASFLFSPEFTTTMNSVFPGRTARAETYLAMNLYGGFLRRLADSGGYTFWDGQFRSAECSANAASAVTAIINTVSSQFLTSGEYVARATSNSQFVDDLYYAMLQRGGDLVGFNFWVAQLNAGVTRDQLRQQFLTSPEMQAQSAAIAAQGCLP